MRKVISKRFVLKVKFISKNVNHSYVLRKPKYDTCARTLMSSPSFSTNVIWVPKALLANLDGPISRWVPKCTS